MRKASIFLVLICLGLWACDNDNNVSSPDKKVSKVSMPDTVGYFAARNLKGLGFFKIGESTYKDVLILIKGEIRNDSKRFKETNYKEFPKYRGYTEKYQDFKFDRKGNIASTFYRENFGSIFKEIKRDTTISFLKEDLTNEEKFGCPLIKEIEMYEYYIGDIQINNLKLKFYKDTLYQIYCSQNDKIDEGFKLKYGDGRSINNSIWKTPNGETNVKPTNKELLAKSKIIKIDEKIFWENKLVLAESSTFITYKYKDDQYVGAGVADCYFIINCKNEFFNKEIKTCETKADVVKKRLEEQNKQRDVNNL